MITGRVAWADQGGQDVVAAVARGAVAVLPAVVGGEQGVQCGEQVVVAARARLDDGHPGRGVRDEDVEEPVAAGRGLAEELFAQVGQVGHRLVGAGGNVHDPGGEGVGHGSHPAAPERCARAG